MDLEEADKIRDAWGKFLEVGNPGLMRMFLGKIPESLLPYPKEKIEEAMDICIEHFEAEGNKQMVETFKASKAALIPYTDDRVAIKQLVQNFMNPSFIKAFYKKNS